MGTLQRFFGGRQPEGGGIARDESPPAASSSASSGETYAAIRRERELHRLMLVEMERRGPEATAEEVYDELAARWDAEHASVAPGGATAAAGQPAQGAAVAPEEMPAWAVKLLEEQRATNDLLRRLVALLEEFPPHRT